MDDRRLTSQLDFIKLADRLKSVTRRNYLIGGGRLENSAEHSWHIALMANVLSEYSNARVDLARVTLMLLVHDLVEVEAGDAYAYDAQAQSVRKEKEERAAKAVFGKLPREQGERFRQLWDEFEAARTGEALFAHAVDHFLPVLQNFTSNGRSWIENGLTKEQVLEYNACVRNGSEKLWHLVVEMVEKGYQLGYLKADSHAKRRGE
jgi:putative hydrolase of HD superfamily